MGITSDVFGVLKFQLPRTLPFKAKVYAAGRISNIELLILVLDFKVNQLYAEQYSQVFLWNAWDMLTRTRRRRKSNVFYTTLGRDAQTATCAKITQHQV